MASAFSYQRETWADASGELLILLPRHWDEAGMDFDHLKLRMNVTVYEVMEKANMLRLYTIRCSSVLVGYGIWFISHGLHTMDTKAAVSDMFYVRPESRKTGVGLRLFRFAENDLHAEGVDVMHTSVNARIPAPGRLLEHLGHKLISLTYGKSFREMDDA